MKSSTAEALPILVVDDDSAIIRTLSDILRLHGYDPETAETGEEGLRRAEQRTPALAVVDLGLPDMDGIELVAKLHALSDRTEVVVLTGNASLESAVAALRENSVDYLVKPVHVEKLLQVVSMAGERWQRRRAEHRLQESEERYRTLFDRNPQPFWVYDRETLRFLAINDAACRHYGYSREELLALTIDGIRPTEDLADAHRLAREAAGQAPRVMRHLKKSGEIIDVEVTTHDLEFGGRPARLVLAVDITDRLAAQRTIEAQVRQQAAVASLGQRALVDDPTTLMREAVALVATTLDVSFVTVLERHADGSAMAPLVWVGWGEGAMDGIVVPISDESQGGYSLLTNQPVIIDDLEAEPRFSSSKRLIGRGARSGMTVVIPGAVHPFGVLAVHDRQKRAFTKDDVHFLQAIAHVIGTAIVRDRTESAMRQTQRLEAVGRLAGSVAHDFNNMLSAITGYAELIQMHEGKVADVKGDVDEILKAAERAAGLTRQLLAFSRQQVLQPRAVHLNAIITNMGGMLRRLIPRDVKVVHALDEALDVVTADPGQLEQVILNLVVNARDAMPDGGTLMVGTANVALDASRASGPDVVPSGDYVVLTVTDTGTGMDAETQARIYEPFFTTKPADHGTGLGLPTVYGIVKQSGGEIVVDSEVGRGTTFKVYLPKAEAVADASRARHTPAGAGERQAGRQG